MWLIFLLLLININALIAKIIANAYLLFKNNPINISSLMVSGCSFFERNNFIKESKRFYCGGDNTIQERIYKQFSSKAKKGDIFIISSRVFESKTRSLEIVTITLCESILSFDM